MSKILNEQDRADLQSLITAYALFAGRSGVDAVVYRLKLAIVAFVLARTGVDIGTAWEFGATGGSYVDEVQTIIDAAP